MIIEDDITIAKTIKEHLSKWDYDAIYVTDFRDIIRQFIQFQPHLVLIDVILPFLTDSTGAMKYARYRKYRWCLSHLPAII